MLQGTRVLFAAARGASVLSVLLFFSRAPALPECLTPRRRRCKLRRGMDYLFDPAVVSVASYQCTACPQRHARLCRLAHDPASLLDKTVRSKLLSCAHTGNTGCPCGASRRQTAHKRRAGQTASPSAGPARCLRQEVSTRILGETTRDVVRNKQRWKRRRTPTQDPSTERA